MKLRNKVNVKSSASPILVSYTFLGAIVVGLLTLAYFNFSSSVSFATDSKKESTAKATGNDFRVLQNGKPIMPVMGVAVNSQGIFNVQVRAGVELKKIKSKPVGAEVAVLRDQTKISAVKFEDVKELKLKDLQPWINSHYKAGDKISIELLNTVLEPGQSVKVYSLASIY